MSASYFALTPAVMSVAMIPGRSSKTCTPSAASRAAHSVLAMARPALLTQYSPRVTDAMAAETEETNTSL